MPSLNAITGATGLVGSHVAQRLAENGQRVRALVRTNKDAGFLQRLGVDIVRGDLADVQVAETLVAEADVVYHCASKTGNWGNWPDHVAGTVETTRSIVRACRTSAQLRRLLHVSSIAVYGHPRPGPEKIGEDAALGQHLWLWDHYTGAKIEAERIVQELGNRATIIRPTWIYGPRDTANLPKLYRTVKQGGVWLIGSGDNLLNMVFVEDVAEAAVLAASHPHAGGEAYNVCTDGELTQRDLTDFFCDALGRPRVRRRIPYFLARAVGFGCEVAGRILRREHVPVTTRHGMAVYVRPTSYSSEKARLQLGWKPRENAREALTQTLRWLERHDAGR